MNINIEKKFYEATKNILLNNLKVNTNPYAENELIIVYDKNSKLSKQLSKWYIKSAWELDRKWAIQVINFDEINKNTLKVKLLSLKQYSTVVLVQSTNFRLDDFRIRLILNNAWVWCVEHNHLSYIKDDEIENYADAIEYKTPYYINLSDKLKTLSDNAKTMTFICNDWSKLEIVWWFEDMKQNTWDYDEKSRWWTFPIWENFTEASYFENVYWELSIYAYPWEDLQVNIVEPFKIKIEKSIITYVDEKAPDNFKELVQKIKNSEDNEVMVRELWFGLNNGISKTKILSDVNAYERVAWFHMSLWKKHQIYRKKLNKKTTQRFHIDIFPDIKEIYIGNNLVYKNDTYIIK